MKNKQKYRAAVIGCGRIGSLLENDSLREKPCTHAGMYHAHPRVILSAGCDINPKRRQQFKKQWNVDAVFPNDTALYATMIPDIVSIAAWQDKHAALARRAAHAGVKVIILEKPITVSLKSAASLIRYCKQKGVYLIVNHERRFDTRYYAVRELLTSGRLGVVQTIYASVLGPPHGRGTVPIEKSTLMHDGTHCIDVLRMLFGQPYSVHARHYRRDTYHAFLSFQHNVEAVIEAGGERDYFLFEMRIECRKGVIVVGNTTAEVYESQPSRHYDGFYELRKTMFPKYKRQPTSFVNEIRMVVDFLDGKRTKLPSTGNDGYAALKIIYAIDTSARSHGKLIRL